ncbi:hypothetical protein BC829DRAFT_401225, partial [Chytridium lagenaria]
MDPAPPPLLRYLVDQTGIGVNTLRAAVVLAASLPLSIICSLLPASPTASHRHLLSVISTSMVGQLLVSALATYFLVTSAPGSLWTPVTVSFLAILHLSAYLFYTQIIYPTISDVSAPLMLMAIKLSTLSWAIYDGTLPEEQLSPGQKSRAVKETPKLLEFLVGPAIEFSDYRRFTKGEAPYDKAPSSGIPSMKTLFLGLLCFGLHMSFVDSWSHKFAATDAFLGRPFLFSRGLIMRCKYYGAWKVSEGICILSGIGYRGRDPTNPNVHLFNRYENVNILELETAQSPRAFIGSWNILTNQWLRNA